MNGTLTVLVERGGEVESRHTVLWQAITAEEQEPDGPLLFARSAAKPFQAIPVVAAGVPEHFAWGDREVALLCASHSATAEQVGAVEAMLDSLGLTEGALLCGAHSPRDPSMQEALCREGRHPSSLHNNCSGKHAGMLGLSLLLKADIRSYPEPHHPVQEAALAAMSAFTGLRPDAIRLATDGCGVPVFGLPLGALARAFGRLMRPEGLPPRIEAAAGRITRAMMAHPEMVAGPGRFTTALLSAGRGELVAKSGAEGVFAVGFADGSGLALKVTDGQMRAVAPAALHVLEHLRRFPKGAEGVLAAFREPPVLSVAGKVVGRIGVAH